MAGSGKQDPVLTRLEWGVFPLGENGLGDREAEGFLKSAERSARELRLPQGAVLNGIVGGLKAGQVCGVMSYRGRSLEILPKINGTSQEIRLALIRMLSVANDLRVSDGEMAQLQTQRNDLLELLIMLFVRRLTKAMKGGMQRKYIRFDEEVAFVRGKLDIGKQLSKRPVAPRKLFCRFDELSENTPLNRLLKATALHLLSVSRRVETQRQLQMILDSFRRVNNSQDPLAEVVYNDRSVAAFSTIIPLARLLLKSEFQNTTSGNTFGVSLLFPMNKLFERYMACRARQTFGGRIVHCQHSRNYALSDNLFRMIPDILFDDQTAPIIVDTKWKQLRSDDPRKLGVSQSDVYQMLAYGHGYASENVRPRLVLLYPHDTALNAPEGVLRRWYVTGSELPLTIATVDISRRRSLQEWHTLLSEVVS
ncbi:hypothetical protein [Maritimibacter sp. UBA3975]|uniref:McrC family protein n=1 Tax=Maritimibacter sp. UBA3975 TaxID=1946833 RepID=UPI000C0B707A|nr:hypothetical protein [Maritimibacter sp. UBA3975]MAM59868.1 hypothetical protein [Maritimibacter sp.]|tara:strand:- start:5187 stop:6452 length:1266 start_codon:yes stop_codon:yes gene_type:complete